MQNEKKSGIRSEKPSIISAPLPSQNVKLFFIILTRKIQSLDKKYPQTKKALTKCFFQYILGARFSCF